MLRTGLLIGAWVGCCGGNFAFQLFTSQDWQMATMRSFFQAGPLIAIWIAERVVPKAEGR